MEDQKQADQSSNNAEGNLSPTRRPFQAAQINSSSKPASDGQQVQQEDNNAQGGLEMLRAQLDSRVEQLDSNLNRVLEKQEYEYLQAYNIYVKRKEKELRDLIETLADKNKVTNFKDSRIQQLEVKISVLSKEAQGSDMEIGKLKAEIKKLKLKCKTLDEEKEFYHRAALDAKRQNKILKVAFGRLQGELEIKKETINKITEVSKDQMLDDVYKELNKVASANLEPDVDTFLTSMKGVHDKSIELPQDLLEHSFVNSSMQSAKNISGVLDASGTKNKLVQSASHKRQMTTIMSRYKQIPTENLKFEQFLDVIFNSKMKNTDIKHEVKEYVSVLETNYTDKIKELQVKVEKLNKKVKSIKNSNVDQVVEKNELESLFVDCVEDIRREVIRRRLKAEITGKKKLGQSRSVAEQVESAEFEDALVKLANLAKQRVKFSEFTQQDRCNLLDLFVNNEKTLLKIYEILFPRQNFNQLQQLKNASDSISLTNINEKNQQISNDLTTAHQNSQFQTEADSHYQPLSNVQQSPLSINQSPISATESKQQTTVLPNILPAIQNRPMLNQQSNDDYNAPPINVRASRQQRASASQSSGGFKRKTPQIV